MVLGADTLRMRRGSTGRPRLRPTEEKKDTVELITFALPTLTLFLFSLPPSRWPSVQADEENTAVTDTPDWEEPKFHFRFLLALLSSWLNKRKFLLTLLTRLLWLCFVAA